MGRMWCELNCSTGWKNSKIDKDRRKSVISSGAKSFSLTIDITKTTHSNMLLSRDSENLKIFQVLKIDYYNICLRNSLPTLKSFIKITQHQNLRQRFYIQCIDNYIQAKKSRLNYLNKYRYGLYGWNIWLANQRLVERGRTRAISFIMRLYVFWNIQNESFIIKFLKIIFLKNS